MQFGELINNLRNLADNEQENVELVKSLDITLCLTNAICYEGNENFGRQKTDKTYKIKFEKEKKAAEEKDNKPIVVNNNEQGEQEEAKDEEEKGSNTKIYLIILPIIAGLLVLLGVGFLIYKLKKKSPVEEAAIEDEDDIVKNKPAKNQTLPQSTKRSIKNLRPPKIIPFQ